VSSALVPQFFHLLHVRSKHGHSLAILTMLEDETLAIATVILERCNERCHIKFLHVEKNLKVSLRPLVMVHVLERSGMWLAQAVD
jgi:hypothetical protein